MSPASAKNFPAFAKLRSWFYGLSQRDQTALKWMAIAISVFLLYFVLWTPAQNHLERNQAAREQAYKDLVWLKENQSRAIALASNNPARNSVQSLAGRSLLSVVSSSAQRFKVNLQRFEPRGEERVNVSLDKVPFNQMMLWIKNLNDQFGIRVEQISVDRSDESGRVSARLSFEI